MYVRKNTNSAGTVYFQLVESYRIGKKVRQRILLSLGKKGDGKLDNLAQAVSRYTDLIKIEDLAKQLDVKQSYILGPLIILERLFEKLGINKAIKEISALHPKISFNMKKILFSLVVSRFIKAGSKLKVYDNQQRSFYPGMFSADLKLQELYRCLDMLSKHKEDMEKSLYWHEKDLFNLEVDVVLYDLTTLRFESVKAEKGKLRQFGYSKEKRSDCTQVVLGLLVDREGLPLGFEVYPGNTFEGHTVVDIVRKMREKFQVRRFIFVGDRGLFSEENLEMLRGKKQEGGNEFIMGMKLGLIKQRHAEFYDKSLFTKVHEGLSVYETKYEKDRLIVTWSKKRADRDRKTREDILSKIKVRLSKKKGKLKGSDFVTNKNYKKYISFPKDRRKFPCVNEDVIKEEEKKDGFFGVVTNVKDMSAKELVSNYKELWRVEDAFGELKGTLKARPVFHWTDKRIVGHLMMCFIAYLCEAYLTRELRKRGSVLKSCAVDKGSIASRALTVLEAMRDLSEVRAIPVKLKEKRIWIRTDIRGNSAELFKAIGVQIPKKILKMDTIR